MARTYERSVDVPDIDVLDWELVDELVALFTPYLKDPDAITFWAEDSRGTHRHNDLVAFRTAIEAEPEQPKSLTVQAWDMARAREFQVWWGPDRYRRGAKFESPEESEVVYLAERTAALLSLARERRQRRLDEERPTSSLSTAKRFLYDQWVVTVGGGLLVVVIIAIVVALTH